MRTPSRFMPKLQGPRTSWFAWPVLGALAVAVAYLAWERPIIFGAIAVLLAIATLQANLKWNRRLRRLAADRSGESICTFARSFDTRVVDTWLIRATYEWLQAYLASSVTGFPVKAEDRLEKDLGLDEDDWSMDMAGAVATRCGRNLEVSPDNPYAHSPVRTVADFVLFLNSQPKMQSNYALERTRGG